MHFAVILLKSKNVAKCMFNYFGIIEDFMKAIDYMNESTKLSVPDFEN